MGVGTLWFMPITPISVQGRLGSLGSYYACSDYTAINPEFGTIDDFRELVAYAHSLGMKVIIDWVANHTGQDHIWTQTNPGFYKKNAEGAMYDSNGWNDVIDLNYYDGLMRKAMIDAMRFWVLECDIDGFRCDMAHLVPLDFWRRARMELSDVKDLFWLAETEDIHYLEVFDACYAWTWMHETEKLGKGQLSVSQLRNVLHNYQVSFPSNTTQLFFTSNHDENSWNGTEYEKYGPFAKPLAVISTLWNGIPLIYSGQEQPNHKRLKFFDKDRIEWGGQPALHEFYKTLFQLHRDHPALAFGNEVQWIPTNADEYVMAFVRRFEGREVLALINLSPNHSFVQLKEGYVSGVYANVFTHEKVDVIPFQSFELRAYESLILVK